MPPRSIDITPTAFGYVAAVPGASVSVHAATRAQVAAEVALRVLAEWGDPWWTSEGGAGHE